MLKTSFTLFCLLLATQGAIAAPVLKTVIGENMAPPWYFAKKTEVGEGIIPDYIRALEKHVGHKIEILILPKYRIRDYYEKNLIDFNCYTTPTWAGPASANFQWSDEVFEIKNLIVTNGSTIKSLEDLKGQRIGTVLKYNYPTLEEAFKSGKVLRDDAANEEANLNKLESDRYKYAVADNYHLAYYLKNRGRSRINPVGYTIERISVRCWVRKGSSLKLSTLNKALAEIKADRTLEKVLKKYK